MDNIQEGKSAAIVGYVTIIGTLIAIFMNNEKKNSFAAFHIRQALGIFLSFHALGYFIGYFDSWTATRIFWLFFFILWLYGFIIVLKRVMKPLPLVGDFFQKLFKNIG